MGNNSEKNIENQQQSVVEKKQPLAKLVIKWLWRILLSLLLIGAIFFQTPLKVTSLIVIFLLASTVLPKLYRKRFWLLVGVVVIVLIVWVFLPDKQGDWRPYTFDDELAALEAKYAIPDEENAAIIYQQLLDLEQKYDINEPNGYWDLPKYEPWSSKDHPQIAKWINNQRPIIQKLIEASKLEKCHFPIDADLLKFEKTLNRNSSMRSWAYLLRNAANNDLANSMPEQAIKKNFAILKMGKHVQQQTTVINALIGISLEAVALEGLKTLLIKGDITEQHIKTVEKETQEIQYDWNHILAKSIEGEKLFTKSLFFMFYEVNSKGKTRLSRDPSARMRQNYQEQLESDDLEDEESDSINKFMLHPSYLWKKLLKAHTILTWFYFPGTPQKASEIIDASYEKVYVMAEPNYLWQQSPKKISCESLFSMCAKLNFAYLIKLNVDSTLSVYHTIHDFYLRGPANRNSCLILVALRRYKNKNGHWPESLDEIKPFADEEVFIDPINNSSYVYKLTNDGFTLYSKGKNNIDDSSEYESTRPDDAKSDDRVFLDDRLFWPKRKRANCD